MTTGTLLHLLAFVGRHEAIKWLLDSGAYPHTLNHKGSTPLHVAALRQHPEAIKVLRFHHADAYTENKVRYKGRGGEKNDFFFLYRRGRRPLMWGAMRMM